MAIGTQFWCASMKIKQEVLALPSLTLCLNKCLVQWFISQYCIHRLRKPVRTDFLQFCVDGKLELKMRMLLKQKW